MSNVWQVTNMKVSWWNYYYTNYPKMFVNCDLVFHKNIVLTLYFPLRPYRLLRLIKGQKAPVNPMAKCAGKVAKKAKKTNPRSRELASLATCYDCKLYFNKLIFNILFLAAWLTLFLPESALEAQNICWNVWILPVRYGQVSIIIILLIIIINNIIQISLIFYCDHKILYCDNYWY